MVISDENSYPIMIDSIHTPVGVDYFWSLNLEERDFSLSKLEVLEEHMQTPILVLRIMGYVVEVPADWNILVYSEETSQLDIVQISEVCRGNFTAFVFNHVKNFNAPGNIQVIDYIQSGSIHTPSINKTQMLCHHLGPKQWICISPVDNYSKYLKGATIGDILP